MPGIQLVPANGTPAIAADSTVKAHRSSGSKFLRSFLPQALAMVCASIVITLRKFANRLLHGLRTQSRQKSGKIPRLGHEVVDQGLATPKLAGFDLGREETEALSLPLRIQGGIS